MHWVKATVHMTTGGTNVLVVALRVREPSAQPQRHMCLDCVDLSCLPAALSLSAARRVRFWPPSTI